MDNETPAAATTNQTDANASTEASATQAASAASETGKQTQTAETQATQSTEKPAAENQTTANETAKTTNAPEKYEFKAPEGTEFDAAILEAFTGAARDADLTQGAAQKILETMAPKLAARQAEQIEAIHEEWRTASAADTEFGGGGDKQKFAENLGVAKKAYDTFATPELRSLLDTTGMGNHPEVIRLMYRIGKAISEDKFVGGRVGEARPKDPTSVLYDKTAAK
jgi:hypothetical protein